MPPHRPSPPLDAGFWLRLATRQAPALLWTTDCDLRFTSHAGAGWRALEVDPDQILGISLAECFSGLEIDFPALLAHRRALRGERVTYEQPWAGVNYLATVEPLRDAAGRVVGCVGVALDLEGRVPRGENAEEVPERARIEETLREEQRLLRRLLDLQEQERKLLAYDIHDGFIQDVVGAKMILEGALSKPDGEFVHPEIEAARRYLGKAIDEGRRLILELRPLIIDEEGILAAIESLVEDEQQKTGIEFSFVHQVSTPRLTPLLEGTLYRIVQEAITNIKRHSQAPSAEIRLLQQDDQLRLEVEDHGVGFDVNRVPRNRFGLEGIRERARLFGGEATIASSRGGSTTIAVVLPLTLADAPPAFPPPYDSEA